MMRITAFAAGLAAAVVLSLPAQAATDWAKVGEALGKVGSVQPGGVYRVGLGRSDLKVTVDGVAVKPSLALGSWVAFQEMGDHAMVMGDLVLTGDEVHPVMAALVEGGINVTAVHNHLLRGSPMTFYMHIDGQGDPVKLAAAIHKGLALSATPMGAAPPAAAPPPLDMDVAGFETALGGYKGTPNGGVLQFTIPRKAAPSAHGMAVPPSMGSGEAINVQPTGGGKVAVTGDFVMTSEEVRPVMQALLAGGIEVTALHNHMLDDQPHLFFMHFWANDDQAKLAKALRAGLDHVAIAPPGK
jgi:hypothetical protein